MKYAYVRKVSNIDDIDFIESCVRVSFDDLFKRFSKKSHKWLYPTVEFFEQDGDNLVHNLVTIRVTANQYKAPRIAITNPRYKRRTRPYA